MLLQQLRKELKNALKEANQISYSKDVDQILSNALNLSTNDIFFSNSFVNEIVQKETKEQVERLIQGEPFAYVLGHTNFFGCKIFLNKNVLIPRQETEILTNLIATDITKKNRMHGTLWDICTGSGCIGIALKKKFPSLNVVLSDISPEALKLAQYNAEYNQVEVEIRQGDFLTPFANQKADIITCNPPYITEEEYINLDPSVKDFEPKSALVAQDNGLFFYKELAKSGSQLLNPEGVLWLEIGYAQGDELKKIFSFKTVIQDLSGHDRFVRVEFP